MAAHLPWEPPHLFPASVNIYKCVCSMCVVLPIVEPLLPVELEVEPVSGELLLGGGHHRLEGVLQQVVAPNVQSRVVITNQS